VVGPWRPARAAEPQAVRPRKELLRRTSRVIIATASGALPVLLLALPELTGRPEIFNPRLLSAMAVENREAWAVILGAALVTGAMAALVVSLIRGPISSFLAAFVIVLLLFCAVLPIYWYMYRGVPPGSHVSISRRRAYAAPLACLVAGLSYSLLGLVDRFRLRKAHDAAA